MRPIYPRGHCTGLPPVSHVAANNYRNTYHNCQRAKENNQSLCVGNPSFPQRAQNDHEDRNQQKTTDWQRNRNRYHQRNQFLVPTQMGPCHQIQQRSCQYYHNNCPGNEGAGMQLS